MRKSGFDRLLAGTMLAAAVTMPMLANAAPDRVESVRPLPPSLNGQVLRHRDAAPANPPDAPAPRRYEAAPETAPPVATPAAESEPAPLQIAAPRDAENATAKAIPDKTLAASDAQIAAKLRDRHLWRENQPNIRRIPPTNSRVETKGAVKLGNGILRLAKNPVIFTRLCNFPHPVCAN